MLSRARFKFVEREAAYSKPGYREVKLFTLIEALKPRQLNLFSLRLVFHGGGNIGVALGFSPTLLLGRRHSYCASIWCTFQYVYPFL